MMPATPDDGVRATVIIPTYGHAPFVRCAIASAQAQTVVELEICVILDGSPPEMSEMLRPLQEQDSRIRVFRFEKGKRTGEPHRAKVISQTTGRIICYLGHDDLWFPNHVESLETLLRHADFGHTLHTDCGLGARFGRVPYAGLADIGKWRWRQRLLQGGPQFGYFGLSFGGHTREAYERLKEGWTTTPVNMLTDQYMWRKFLGSRWCRAASLMRTTGLHFPVQDWAGRYAPDKMEQELARYLACMASGDLQQRINRRALIQGVQWILEKKAASVLKVFPSPVGELLSGLSRAGNAIHAGHAGKSGTAKSPDGKPAVVTGHKAMRIGPHMRVDRGEGLDCTGRRVAIVSHGDPEGVVHEYLLYYLQQLKALGFAIILSSENEARTSEGLGRVLDGAVRKDCFGHEYVRWKGAMECFPSVSSARELLLTSDRIIGPLRPLAPIFDAMNDRKCDFWGLAHSHARSPHVQDSFLVFRESGLQHPSFSTFWDRVDMAGDVRGLARGYAPKLSAWFFAHGLDAAVRVPPSAVPGWRKLSPELFHWKGLLREHGHPFLRMEIAAGGHWWLNTRGWKEELAATGYPVELVTTHLRRPAGRS